MGIIEIVIAVVVIGGLGWLAMRSASKHGDHTGDDWGDND